MPSSYVHRKDFVVGSFFHQDVNKSNTAQNPFCHDDGTVDGGLTWFTVGIRCLAVRYKCSKVRILIANKVAIRLFELLSAPSRKYMAYPHADAAPTNAHIPYTPEASGRFTALSTITAHKNNNSMPIHNDISNNGGVYEATTTVVAQYKSRLPHYFALLFPKLVSSPRGARRAKRAAKENTAALMSTLYTHYTHM